MTYLDPGYYWNIAGNVNVLFVKLLWEGDERHDKMSICNEPGQQCLVKREKKKQNWRISCIVFPLVCLLLLFLVNVSPADCWENSAGRLFHSLYRSHFRLHPSILTSISPLDPDFHFFSVSPLHRNCSGSVKITMEGVGKKSLDSRLWQCFSSHHFTPTLALSSSLSGSVVIKVIHACGDVIPVWLTVRWTVFVCLFILLSSPTLFTYCLSSGRSLRSNILYLVGSLRTKRNVGFKERRGATGVAVVMFPW